MWQIQKVADEGTSEPYVARLWSGAIELRDLLLRHQAASDRDLEIRRRHFDDRYRPLLDALGAARKHAARVRELIATHTAKVSTGAIVSRQRNALQIDETIHIELQEEVAAFLSSSARATKSVQVLTGYLGLEIGFLFQQPQKFAAVLERLQATGDVELAEYLQLTRTGWSELLIERRHALEHQGWRLPDMRYIEQPDGMVRAVEPDVDGLPVSEFVARMTNHLLGFVEDLIALAVQRGIADIGDLIDIPPGERDEAHVKRFRFGVPALQPTERFWRLQYSTKGFYGS